ncbi:hypothetical protein [Marichromatium bheemlicum]|uniref:Uncharacterized protein n=1 Tax=Marichromatium bheemlicum TaxID=365339 RepID=A0ABX1IA76_9GAMM|nr:hypothetical protein [Marichromatium bheemlicum]NKN34432.1 hypothetical protein [Marichromatium bheemlicum]
MTDHRQFQPRARAPLLRLVRALVQSRPRSRTQQRRWLLRRHLSEQRPPHPTPSGQPPLG